MKRVLSLLCFLLVVCLTCSTITYAREIKIGYVDVQKVLNESRLGRAEKKALEDEGRKVTSIIQRKQGELKALKESLEKQAVMLSEAARREKEREYQRELKEFERLVKDSRDELRQKERERTGKVLKSIQQMVSKVGQEEKFTVILEKTESFILYAPKEIDLTDKIIKALDAQKE